MAAAKQGKKKRGWSPERRAAHQAKKAARRMRAAVPSPKPFHDHPDGPHEAARQARMAEVPVYEPGETQALGDPGLPLDLQVVELKGAVRCLQERLDQLAPKPAGPKDPQVSREAVQRMIIASFQGMPDWNAIGSLHRKLIEGLEKL